MLNRILPRSLTFFADFFSVWYFLSIFCLTTGGCVSHYLGARFSTVVWLATWVWKMYKSWREGEVLWRLCRPFPVTCNTPRRLPLLLLLQNTLCCVTVQFMLELFLSDLHKLSINYNSFVLCETWLRNFLWNVTGFFWKMWGVPGKWI